MPPAFAQRRLDRLVAKLRACERCPKMQRPAVSGGAVVSRVMAIGQAPGVKEPKRLRYAWANNPSGNLWGANGLPATPFEASLP